MAALIAKNGRIVFSPRSRRQSMPIISTSIASLPRAERVEPWLICKSDCNDHPPPLALCRLDRAVRRGGLSAMQA